MITRKLKKMPYAQACVREYDDGAVSLISYYTCAVHITRDGWLMVSGLFSATTRRHISAFMQEYGLTYELAKMLCNDEKQYNIYTGEVIEE